MNGHVQESDAADVRHRLLRAVDRALGAEAELARSRANNARLNSVISGLRGDLDRAADQAQRLQAARDRDAAQLAAVYSSQTWRVGRSIVGPAARVARRVRSASARATAVSRRS